MAFDLHHQLQEIYADDSGECEVTVGASRVDVLRDGVVYEIQTNGLYQIRRKIACLLDDWPVVIVHPVARKTVFVYCEGDPPTEARRRTGPRTGSVLDAFAETVSVAKLLAHPNLSLELPLIDVEDIRRRTTDEEKERIRKRRKRRRNSLPDWTTINRRLITVHEVIRLDIPADGVQLLPNELPDEFTSRILGDAIRLSAWRARQVSYTLRHMGSIEQVRRTKDGIWYRRCERKTDA